MVPRLTGVPSTLRLVITVPLLVLDRPADVRVVADRAVMASAVTAPPRRSTPATVLPRTEVVLPGASTLCAVLVMAEDVTTPGTVTAATPRLTTEPPVPAAGHRDVGRRPGDGQGAHVHRGPVREPLAG